MWSDIDRQEVPALAPQILHALAWDWTRASALKEKKAYKWINFPVG